MLLSSDDVGQRETSHDGSSHAVVELVLEHGLEVAILVYLELAGGLIVELVRHTESCLNSLSSPVEGELGANNLRVVGDVVHEYLEFAELEVLLVLEGLVLESNEGVASQPREAEVVLLDVGSL